MKGSAKTSLCVPKENNLPNPQFTYFYSISIKFLISPNVNFGMLSPTGSHAKSLRLPCPIYNDSIQELWNLDTISVIHLDKYTDRSNRFFHNLHAYFKSKQVIRTSAQKRFMRNRVFCAMDLYFSDNLDPVNSCSIKATAKSFSARKACRSTSASSGIWKSPKALASPFEPL